MWGGGWGWKGCQPARENCTIKKKVKELHSGKKVQSRPFTEARMGGGVEGSVRLPRTERDREGGGSRYG